MSSGRSAVATGTGAGLGYLAAGGTVIAAEALGLTALASIAAPVVAPVVILAGGIAFLRSRFD